MKDVQIALATDPNYLRLALIAMGSVIERASQPVTVHFLADSLTDSAREITEAACAQVRGTKLVWHDLTDILPTDIGSVWPKTILARLFLPKLVDEKVLYLDADTMTFSDICPLFKMDMNGNPIAAVRDFVFLNRCMRLKSCPQTLEYLTNLMNPYPVHDYFNSGVILMDCCKIKRDHRLLDSITDMKLTTKYEKTDQGECPDQDHLNYIFKGRTLLIDPMWNSLYGRIWHTKRIAKATLPEDLVHKAALPKIVHILDDPEPWLPIDAKLWTKTSFLFRKLPMLIRYRINAFRISLPFRKVARALKQENILYYPPPKAEKFNQLNP